MQNPPLTINRLAIMNLKHRWSRTMALIMIIAVLFFVLFGGLVISISLTNGLNSLENRFGADLMIVPQGYDEKMEAILLKGEPSSFYLDKTIVNQILEIDGIEELSSQFFLTSLGESCCAFPVQMIGFDPKTDFSIKPWISKVYGEEIADGTLVVGSDISVGEKKTLKFFEQEYLVVATLEKTGTGLDQAIFVNMHTMEKLYESALAKGQHFLEEANPKQALSSILIKVEDGYEVEDVVQDIQSQIEGIQILQTQNMISDIAEHLKSLFTLIYILAAFFLIITLVTLVMIFSITANERKKEFAIWRILGATQQYLTHMLLRESVIVSGLGGMIGIALAAITTIPFSSYIGDRLGLPYIQSQWSILFIIFISCLGLSLIVGPLAAGYSVIKISKVEPYITLREGEY